MLRRPTPARSLGLSAHSHQHRPNFLPSLFISLPARARLSCSSPPTKCCNALHQARTRPGAAAFRPPTCMSPFLAAPTRHLVPTPTHTHALCPPRLALWPASPDRARLRRLAACTATRSYASCVHASACGALPCSVEHSTASTSVSPPPGPPSVTVAHHPMIINGRHHRTIRPPP